MGEGQDSRQEQSREALGPIPRRTGAGVTPGKGSRAGERWNQGDTNNVMVKECEKKTIGRWLPQETKWLQCSLCQGHRKTEHPRVNIVI